MLAGAGVAWLMDRNLRGLKRQREHESGVGLDAFLLLLIVGICFGMAARARDRSFTPRELAEQAEQAHAAGDRAECENKYRDAAQLDPAFEPLIAGCAQPVYKLLDDDGKD
jgi:hypothetical protein